MERRSGCDLSEILQIPVPESSSRDWTLGPKKPPKTDRLGLKFETQTEGLGLTNIREYVYCDALLLRTSFVYYSYFNVFQFFPEILSDLKNSFLQRYVFFHIPHLDVPGS